MFFSEIDIISKLTKEEGLVRCKMIYESGEVYKAQRFKSMLLPSKSTSVDCSWLLVISRLNQLALIGT